MFLAVGSVWVISLDPLTHVTHRSDLFDPLTRVRSDPKEQQLEHETRTLLCPVAPLGFCLYYTVCCVCLI